MDEIKDMYSRTKLLLGREGVEKLKSSVAAIVGIGGVGSYTAEAVARAGVGSIILIDADVVDVTNINRQLIALNSTIGQYKAEVMKRRILDINPDCNVTAHTVFYQNGVELFENAGCVADAIDSVTSKLNLIQSCCQSGIPVISAMGAGNKLDPSRFETADIYATSVCPLCRVMRHELRKRGVPSLKVVYSKEEPINAGGRTPGSVSFVPSAAGLLLAAELVKTLLAAK